MKNDLAVVLVSGGMDSCVTAAIANEKYCSAFLHVNSELRTSDIPSTYVPFRNAHLLSIATSWAEVIGATKIFIGAVEEDGSGYPDCRESFYHPFNKVIEMGTGPG